MKKSLPPAWLLAILVVGAVVLTLSPLGVRLEEDIGLRLLFWLRGPLPPPEDVVIVAVDEDSSTLLELPEPDELAQWPRAKHAEVINHLANLGAKVIAVDIAFAEPRDPSQDSLLADAIAKANNVVLLKLLQKIDIGNGDEPMKAEIEVLPAAQFRQRARAVASFTLQEQPIKKYAELYKQTPSGLEATMPMVALQTFDNNAQQALVNSIRHSGWEQTLDANYDLQQLQNADPGVFAVTLHKILNRYPALASQLTTQLQSTNIMKDRCDPRVLKALLTGYRQQGPVYLNFYGPRHTIKTISYHKIVNREVPASDIEGKVVFIGLSETRTKQRDYFYTIFSGDEDVRFSGVEIAATLFGNLLQGIQLRTLVGWQHVTIVGLLSLALIVSALLLPLRRWVLFFCSIFVIYFACCYWLFNRFAVWTPLVTPLFIFAPILAATIIGYHHRLSIRQNEIATTTLQHYLPHDVALQMRDNVARIQHQRETVQGVCLLTDLVGFTAFAEKCPPTELHSLMNNYYRQVSQIIQKYNGVVANIVGDGLLALWTAIELNDTLKSSACYAALDIINNVAVGMVDAGTLSTDTLNTNDALQKLQTCIGIHCGEISLGNLGAAGHYEYAPVGDTINTTARLEAYNRQLGTRILISDAVGADIRLFMTQYHGKVLFKGKTQAVGVYELQDLNPGQ